MTLTFELIVFIAAILAELCVIYLHFINANETAPAWVTMGYLWYNIVGCGLVVVFGFLIQSLNRK